jgi:hypothetical protein
MLTAPSTLAIDKTSLHNRFVFNKKERIFPELIKGVLHFLLIIYNDASQYNLYIYRDIQLLNAFTVKRGQ